jgi:CO/xanthine dehydrogenase FAD-binding subunit
VGEKEMKRFEYFAPANISEALKLLDIYREKAKILAGGTDLLVQMKKNDIRPDYLVDLKRIPDLSGIQYNKNEGLHLGALTTISEIESSIDIRKNFPILSEVAKVIGSVQVRNRGTIGGNLCRAAPSADFAPILIVMNAKVKIMGKEGEGTADIKEFFIGPGETILKPNEILKEIRIPNSKNLGAAVYLRHGPRQTMDLSVVGAAVFIAINKIDMVCKDLKIALGSVAPTPIRAKKAEEIILGKKVTQSLIEESAKIAAQETSPISDVYGPAWYKKEVVVVLVRRAILQAIKKLQEI